MNNSASSLHTLPVGNKLRDMLITEVLGQGGFGITYKAHDPRLNRFVVIKEYMPQDLAVRQSDKTVAPHSGSAAENFHWGLDSFLKEAQILARFQHPNIVPVLDFFETNGTAYMVMPFIEGETLGRRLEKSPSGIMSEQDIRAWLLPLLDGLQAIHAQGFLHRDLKPENTYLAHNGAPLLIDFGAARNALGSRSRSLSVVLTPGYAPPEQYGSSVANQGPWTDMYALGAVVYRCLTGQAPVDSTERQDSTINNEQDPLVPHLQNLARVASPEPVKTASAPTVAQLPNMVAPDEVPPPALPPAPQPPEPPIVVPQQELPMTPVMQLYKLTIKTVPPNATVRIMNIEQRYTLGMELEPGRYDVEVSAAGYEQKREWVIISATNTHKEFILKELNNAEEIFNKAVFFSNKKDC